MTLELKQYKQDWCDNSTDPYTLGGVKKITNQTEYGEGHFEITIFDRKVFATDFFEYVKDRDTGELFVKDGKWIFEEKHSGGSFNSSLGCFTTCTIC